MARRELLTETERQALFGVPADREDLTRHYMLSTNDLALVAARRGSANQIGFAVHLALLRHPGFGFTLEAGAPAQPVAFMGEQIGVPASGSTATPRGPQPHRTMPARRRRRSACGRRPTPTCRC